VMVILQQITENFSVAEEQWINHRMCLGDDLLNRQKKTSIFTPIHPPDVIDYCADLG
jgi:hypothetical protein